MGSTISTSYGKENIEAARLRNLKEKKMAEKKKQQVESVPPYSDDDEFDFSLILYNFYKLDQI